MSSGLAVGQTVAGRYRLDAVIGEGGFGTVFRATELRLERAVALKVLKREVLVRDGNETRFTREAQLAKSLEHPNTVRLLDFGHIEDGTPFIAYELLRGLALDELLHAVGKISAERAARIARQVLKSLMEAHAQGIVHRDIKPSNIYLCEFSGETDFVKVLDFGIAKAESHNRTALTAAGVAIGTPAYMAPEQVRAQGVGPATDVYALGLVMAEAMTGKMVMDAHTPALVALAQLSDDPVPLAPEVRQSPLGSIIARAVEKDPSRRYASAAEMLRDLEQASAALTAGTPVQAQHQSQVFTGGQQVSSPTAHGDTTTVDSGQTAAPPRQAWGATPAHGGYAAPPMGAGAGHGYPMPAPPPNYGAMPIPQTKSGSGCIWALVGVGGLVLLLAVGGAALVMSRRASTGGSTSSGSGSSSGRLRDLRGDDLKARLKSHGWEITGESNSTSEAFRMNVFQLSRSGASGTVQLYEYADENMAKLVEDQMRNNLNEGAALERDGGSLLFVFVIAFGGNSDVTSSQLLSDVKKP